MLHGRAGYTRDRRKLARQRPCVSGLYASNPKLVVNGAICTGQSHAIEPAADMADRSEGFQGDVQVIARGDVKIMRQDTAGKFAV